MSLSIYLDIDLYDQHGRFIQNKNVFCENITHNLNTMARECGLYDPMWAPSAEIARDVTFPLVQGIQYLVDNKDRMDSLNPENGWGNSDNLLDVAINYLNATLRYPESKITACR